MKKLTAILTAALLTAVLAASAQADYGLSEFDATYSNADGSPVTQAGSHPFAQTTNIVFNRHGDLLDGDGKDVLVKLPPGFAGNPTAVPTCKTADFITQLRTGVPNCSDSPVIGVAKVEYVNHEAQPLRAIYNLPAPPGRVSAFGFYVFNDPVIVTVGVNPDPPYNVEARATNASTQAVPVFSSKITLWGVPASPAHDGVRGACAIAGGTCPVALPEIPFITMPRSCHGPLLTTYATDSWQNPGAYLPSGQPDLSDPAWVTGSSLTHDEAEPPSPLGTTGCGKLAFAPSTTAAPTARAASSPTGLDFGINLEDEGFDNPAVGAIAAADIEKAVVTLPAGMTVNPSIAEGLAVCSEAALTRETPSSEAGAGCPSASKIGSLEVQTPELPGVTLGGSLYQAAPYENPEHSLIALYAVIKDPTRGINVVQPLRVETDPVTGRITTVSEEMPQVPLSHVRFHFREGTRSPLATPPSCGPHAVEATFYPSSGGAPAHTSSVFEIISGPESGPCPSGGTPPFHPGLNAGTLNNAAGAYSPFNLRLFRTDSEQEITHFSIKLPPGVSGKLAGIPFCPEAAIAAAKARERQPHGGQEELDRPSCPAPSEIGHTLVGSGVGPSLAYVPGKVYLAGPYNGSNLSIVAITAAKAGPFDLGTVVVREALRINPETAEVFVDATGSDPIPHIVNGIPVHLRDVRVYVDRPDFVLNPTSCKPTSTASTILGSGTNFASEADDQPVTVTTRFQAADCASLGYKPAVQLKLKGSTKRSGHPALTAILRPRAGDANSRVVSVALPHSEFLDQGHIKTICTRVQFKAGAGNGSACPAGAIYGHAKAWTPLLSEPLEGPVLLRANPEHTLPDLVLALHGLIEFDAVGRIDSVNGGIRNTFEAVPDAPVSKVEVSFQGGKKGLLENSTNLCIGSHKATTKYTAQSGKAYEAKVALQAQCGGGGKKNKKKQKRAGRPSALLRLGSLGAW
jgi:hypothetical protein